MKSFFLSYEPLHFMLSVIYFGPEIALDMSVIKYEQKNLLVGQNSTGGKGIVSQAFHFW